MARMLDETFPSDLHDKIQQVRAIVPNCSEEEVCIALHDHDYDPEKAISALLDSEAQVGTGEGTGGGGGGGTNTV